MSELIPWVLITVGLAVIVIHFNVGRLLDEQKRHHREAEGLLREIRDCLRPGR